MRPHKHAHHKVHLSGQFYADIAWWINFMAVFKGRCLALQNAPLHEVYQDASNGGAGYVFDTDWGYTNWKNDLPSAALLHISDKKFFSAILAAQSWVPLWANSRVLFHTDNITARAALRKGSAKCSAITPLLCELFWLSAIFYIDACYISGGLNDTPACISRLKQPGYVAQLLNLMGIPVNCMRYVYIWLFSICLMVHFVLFHRSGESSSGAQVRCWHSPLLGILLCSEHKILSQVAPKNLSRFLFTNGLCSSAN